MHTYGTGMAIIDPTLIRIIMSVFFIVINREPLCLPTHYYKHGFCEQNFDAPPITLPGVNSS